MVPESTWGTKIDKHNSIMKVNISGEISQWLPFFSWLDNNDEQRYYIFINYNIYRRARIGTRTRYIAENETTKKPGVTSSENQQPSEPSLALVRDYDI